MIVQMAEPAKQPTLVTLESQKPAKLSALQIDPMWVVVLAMAAVIGWLVWEKMKED